MHTYIHTSQVLELLTSERKLVGETSALLDTVVKVTDGVESALGVHRVAVDLQRDEQTVRKLANELEEHIQAIPVWGNGAEAAVGGLDLAGAREMERLSRDLMAAMSACHGHLVTLAESATRFAQMLDEDGAALGDVAAAVDALEGEGPKDGFGANGDAREGFSRKWQEKRNAYAVSVLKRVKQKIEGREGGAHKMTVADQVCVCMYVCMYVYVCMYIMYGDR
jgi:hypothetical protein